jgi:predicted RNA-binding protein YlxR (DUF448 family)
MGVAARKRTRTGGDGAEPERTCIVTRAKLTPEDLIRFVRGPDGQMVPDLACRLPGRGVWVACRRQSVAEAQKRNAFARALKGPATVPEGLADTVEMLLRQRAAGALGFANKAGLVVTGFAKVDAAVASGKAIALIHASDAAPDGRGKLDRKFRAVRGENEENTVSAIVADLSADELSLAIGRANVVHAALTKGGAAQNFLREAGRLRRYRTDWDVEAARPHAAGSKTGQA